MSSFKPLVKSRRHWTPPHRNNDVYYRTTTYRYTKAENNELDKVIVRIGSDIMKELGWKVGDKLVMLQDEEDELHLKLVKDNRDGYIIKPSCIPQGETYMDQKGKHVRGTFEGTIDDIKEIPRTHKTTVKINEWKINSEGLEFKVPRNI